MIGLMEQMLSGRLIHKEDGTGQPLGLIADSVLIEMFLMYKIWQ